MAESNLPSKSPTSKARIHHTLRVASPQNRTSSLPANPPDQISSPVKPSNILCNPEHSPERGREESSRISTKNPTLPDPTRPVHADIAAWRGCPDEIETGGKADIRPADRNTIIIQAAVHGPHNGFLQGEGKGVSREGEGRSNLVARSRINSARIEGPKSACFPPPVNIPEKSWRHPAPGRGDHCVISFHFSGGGTNSWRLNLGKEFIFASDSKVVCLDV